MSGMYTVYLEIDGAWVETVSTHHDDRLTRDANRPSGVCGPWPYLPEIKSPSQATSNAGTAESAAAAAAVMPTEMRDRRDGAESAKGKAAVAVRDVSNKKEKTSGPMDKWVEPALATKASYEDHNGQPFGVLEHMQPLGEPPSSKVKARVKAEPRKSMLAKNAATVQSTAESTPQPQPQPQLAVKQEVLPEMEELPPVNTSKEPVLLQKDDTDDEDYAPELKKKKKVTKTRASRVSAVKPESKSTIATAQPEKTRSAPKAQTAVKSSSSSSSTAATAKPREPAPKTTSRTTFRPPHVTPGQKLVDKDNVVLRPEACNDAKIREIVEESKSKAIDGGNQEVADHVHALWEDSIKKARLRTVLVKVLTNTASAPEIDEFHVYIKAAKRRVNQRKTAGTHIPATATGPPLEPSLQRIVDGNKTKATTNGEVAASSAKIASSTAVPPKSESKVTVKKTKQQRQLEARAKEMDENPYPENYTTEEDEIIDCGDPDFDDDDYDKRRRIGRWHWTEHPRLNSPPAGFKKTSQRDREYDWSKQKYVKIAAPRKVTRPDAATPAASKPTQTSTTLAKSSAPTPAVTKAAPVAPQVVQTVEKMDISNDAQEQPTSRPSREPARINLTVPQPNSLKRTSEDAELDKKEDNDSAYEAKKQRLSEKIVHQYEAKESNERTLVESPGRKKRVSVRMNGAADETRTTRLARNSLLDDDSDNESELSSVVSHHNTPPPFTLTASSNKRAKTKQSPQKKPANITAGLTGATASDSPMDVDYSEEASENNDFCSACRGSGYLLCCDGCDRSFHFQCLDPPLDPQDERLNEPWFCFDCVAHKRLMGEDSPSKISHGLFAPLLNDLRKRNPTIFALPSHIQKYYAGVGADEHGHFMNEPRAGTRRRAGFGDPVDLYKLRDTKGNLLFCYHCMQTSQGDRQVAQCDECAQIWHLDCLDPPLAIHPCITGDGRKVADWICPLHVEHELKQIDARRLFNDQQGRRLKIRRPRGAKVRETFLSRGARNNGNIEILEVESSDESDNEEFFDVEDPRRDGVILKMPDKGIKLDFIDKIKQDRIQQYRDAVFDKQIHGKAQGSRVQMINTRRLADFDTPLHSLQERQTAINLAQFAHADSNADLGLGNDNIETLVMSLVAEAPQSILDTDSSTSKSVKNSDDEKTDLLALQRLIARRLEALNA